ncbi:MAG: hypothetical protein ACLGGX_08920 [Bdellovibrionia bacterium]
MKLALVLTLLILSTLSEICFASKDRNCFTRHLREAIVINNERSAEYQKLTQNQSTEITHRLVMMEKGLLLGAYLVDKLATYWQDNQIPMICNDFIEMSLTPASQTSYADRAPLQPIPEISLNSYQSKVSTLLKKNDFNSIEEITEAHLAVLSLEPRAHCLVRHFLESILRISYHTPKYIEQARNKNIQSPRWLLKTVIKNHLPLLAEAKEIDNLALKFQKQHVPIVCQDVPPIPKY